MNDRTRIIFKSGHIEEFACDSYINADGKMSLPVSNDANAPHLIHIDKDSVAAIIHVPGTTLAVSEP